MNKRNIALLAGGYSGEREISFKSAKTVLDHIDTTRYELFLIDVSTEGLFYRKDGQKSVRVDETDFSLTLEQGKVKFDYAYVIVHGTPGEDGRLQAYLDMKQVPYNTGDMLNMALTFNKGLTQTLLKGKGIQVADHEIFRFPEVPEGEDIEDIFGWPVFVKATESGSSIGIHKVKSKKGLKKAVLQAYRIHPEVIVEKALVGREMTCGVYSDDGRIAVLPVTEVVSKREFFDYEAKYNDDLNEEITPADVPEDIYQSIQELAAVVYHELSCQGLVRVDFFLCGHELFVVEVNTVPGFSSESIVPKQLETAGLPIKDFISLIIESAFTQESIEV